MTAYQYTGSDLVDDLGIELGQPHEPIPTSAWIDPRGRFYPLADCDHETFAYRVHNTTAYVLERNGWVHLSFGSVMFERRITQSQLDTLMDTLVAYEESRYWAAERLADQIRAILEGDSVG